jgi:hypothetical protein
MQTLQWFSVSSHHLDFSVMQTLQWFSVSSHHIDFSVIQPFQCLSVSSNHLHYVAIKYAFPSCRSLTTRYRMSLYKDMSSRNTSSDYTYTPPLYPHTAHALPFSKCLVTLFPHGTSVHSAIVVDEQSLPSLWCRPHMEGDVRSILTLTQVATYASIYQFHKLLITITILILT